MSRRSIRLATSGYYQDDDDASSSSGGSVTIGAPSYKESPVRISKRRPNSKRSGLVPTPGIKRSTSNSSVNSQSSFASHVSNASTRSQQLASVSGWQEPEPVVGGVSSFEDNYEGRSGMLKRANGFRTGILTTPAASSEVYTSSTSGYSSEEEQLGSTHSAAFSPVSRLWGWVSVLSPGKALSMMYWWLGTTWYQLTTAVSLLDVFTLSRCVPYVKRWLLLVLLVLLGVCLLISSRSIWSRAEKPVEGAGEAGKRAVGSREAAASVLDLTPQSDLQARVRRMEQQLEQLTADFRAWLDRGSGRDQSREAQPDHLTPPLTPAHVTKLLGEMTSQKLEELRDSLPIDSLRRVQADIAAIQQKQEEQTEPELRAVSSQTQEMLQKVKGMESAVESMTDEQKKLLAALGQLEEQLSQTQLELLAMHTAQRDVVSNVQALGSKVESMTDDVETALGPLVHKLLFGSSSESTEVPSGQALTAQLVHHKELEILLAGLEKKILAGLSRYPGHATEQNSAVVRVGITEEVKNFVEQALKLYSADRIGLVDYALESAGASVISTRCSETFETKTALLSLFGVPLWYYSQSPRAVIQPDVHPGNCWAFKGSQGFVVIQLAARIRPTAFTLEHIPKSIALLGSTSSAPRDFSVFGLDDENREEGFLFGQYTYSQEADSIQTFHVQNKDLAAYQVIELRVNSNWGHPEYTCLYRFRVHGEPMM
ncbi:SUN domain-containing protein 2-like [Pristis pectinata]|uniref:SUN domain-containing protein 2-like n=1 Tax=Pristis pectinata TaxID=685728 RepID=UPI00223D12D5|nr:SUN domain-containing protein 2-like [Pristis pectinata]XP_051899372.1 SUN domain-containing protein 2-like [Pristis pectinata]